MAFDPSAITGALSGNPISMAFGLAGLGAQLFGGIEQAGVAKQQAQISSEIAGISGQEAGQEQQIEAQKMQQMQLEAGRLNLQNFRKTQQIKAAGLAGAVSGGAEFGSGLAGAQAGETAAGLSNSLGINQNLAIGQNIFGLNSKISGERIQTSQLQSQSALLGGTAATAQGISSLGGAAISIGPTIGSFGKNLGIG